MKKLIFLSLLMTSCVYMPVITPKGKVSATEKEPVALWNVDDHAGKMMETKGYTKPKRSTQKQSNMWMYISGICALGAIACFVGAYLTHAHKFLGAGGILAGSALITTGISVNIGLIGWIVGALIIIGLLYLGVRLKDWHWNIDKRGRAQQRKGTKKTGA